MQNVRPFVIEGSQVKEAFQVGKLQLVRLFYCSLS